MAYDAAKKLLWIGDAYGPLLLKVSSTTGGELKRYQPGGGAGVGALPAVLALRRANRGLTGLCLDNTTGRLHGVLAGALDPLVGADGAPATAGGRRVGDYAPFVRWLEFDPATEASSVYVLPIDTEGMLGLVGPGAAANGWPALVTFADLVCLGGGKFVILVEAASPVTPTGPAVAHALYVAQVPAHQPQTLNPEP